MQTLFLWLYKQKKNFVLLKETISKQRKEPDLCNLVQDPPAQP